MQTCQQKEKQSRWSDSELREIFDNFLKVPYELIEKPGYHDQIAGRDLIVKTKRRKYRIELKRREKYRPPDDFWAEMSSLDSNGESQVGFMDKLDGSDYLIYFWESIQAGYLIDSRTLNEIWIKNKDYWQTIYPIKQGPWSRNRDTGAKYRYCGLILPFAALKADGVKCKRFQLGL